MGIQGGFRGWPIQWNHAKCCGADPCCHGNEISARRGDPVAYHLVTVFLFNVMNSYRCFDVITLRPSIWLMAADSFSVHSSITFCLISFINSMNAFSGFLTTGRRGVRCVDAADSGGEGRPGLP